MIPFHKPWLEEDDFRAVTESMATGWLTTGQACARFEAELAAYTGAAETVIERQHHRPAIGSRDARRPSLETIHLFRPPLSLANHADTAKVSCCIE